MTVGGVLADSEKLSTCVGVVGAKLECFVSGALPKVKPWPFGSEGLSG
jgi:hypothetical protein